MNLTQRMLKARVDYIKYAAQSDATARQIKYILTK